MKRLLLLPMLFALGACGNTYIDGEAIGQAKKVTQANPIFCPGYYAFDISLGIMQNGSGSMSTQDMWLTVENVKDIDAMQRAVEAGSIVKIKYNTRRVAFCTEPHVMTAFSVVR